MNKLENLYAKRELLLKELGKVEEMITRESGTADMTNLESRNYSLEQEIAKIKESYALEAYKIDMDVLDNNDCMSEHEWFAYMAHAKRKKSVNWYKCELECAQFNSKALEQIDHLDDKLRDIKECAELDLKLLPILIKRAGYRVESSYYYYQVVSGQMTRMDYETWLFGNKKVPSGEDEDFARRVERSYKAYLKNDEDIIRSSHK